MSSDIQWVEVPKGGGRGRGTQRRAAATLIRTRNQHKSSNKLHVMASLLEAIGSPTAVKLVVDKTNRRCAILGDASGRHVYVRQPRIGRVSTNREVTANGLSEALGLPGVAGSVRFRAAIKDNMILMEPIGEPESCAHCGGSGVKK